MLVRPDTRSELLRSKLSRESGVGSQFCTVCLGFGSPHLPISLLGIFGAVIGLATLAPTPVGEPANPYATPYEILPEWFLFLAPFKTGVHWAFTPIFSGSMWHTPALILQPILLGLDQGFKIRCGGPFLR